MIDSIKKFEKKKLTQLKKIMIESASKIFNHLDEHSPQSQRIILKESEFENFATLRYLYSTNPNFTDFKYFTLSFELESNMFYHRIPHMFDKPIPLIFVRSKMEFIAEDENELSVQADQVLVSFDSLRNHWIFCCNQRENKYGFVPSVVVSKMKGEMAIFRSCSLPQNNGNVPLSYGEFVHFRKKGKSSFFNLQSGWKVRGN